MDDISETSIDKGFAVGVMRGTYAGLGIAISLAVLGGVIPVVWRASSAYAHEHWSTSNSDAVSQAEKPFEAHTIDDRVSYIGISRGAMYSIGLRETRRILEKEMVPRMYFDARPLERGTVYWPKLARPNDPRSVVTLTNGSIKKVVVWLVPPEAGQSPFGLIPLYAYEHYLKTIGK